jgi:hypothetical protein
MNVIIKKGIFCLKIEHCESGNRTQISEIIAALKGKNQQTGNKYILGYLYMG